MGNGENNC